MHLAEEALCFLLAGARHGHVPVRGYGEMSEPLPYGIYTDPKEATTQIIIHSKEWNFLLGKIGGDRRTGKDNPKSLDQWLGLSPQKRISHYRNYWKARKIDSAHREILLLPQFLQNDRYFPKS